MLQSLIYVKFTNESLKFYFPLLFSHLFPSLHRYLQNWEDFRYTCTVIFAVVILVLFVWLVIYLLRALYLLHELHMEGEAQTGDILHATGSAIIK